MFRNSVFKLSLAWVGAIVLLILVVLTFQLSAVTAQDSDDKHPEEEKAGPTGQRGQQEQSQIASPANLGNVGGTFQLFAGNDTTPLPQALIDVSTSDYITAFIGVDAWGAAFDPVNNKVYHNDGSSLYEWPVGGTPNLLGTIMDSGIPVTVHGLAFYNDTLYATSITTDQIYTIDVGTLEATSIITLLDTAASISGLAIDPNTGIIYGTDDGNNDALVIINNDGTLTPEAPYLDGETDVDGLAISSGGQAYLITDDNTPPYYNIYDFNVMTYTGVISYPWTGTAVQVSGAWVEGSNPDIVLTKTVGLDANVCATNNTITLTMGTTIYYCYTATNTGNVILNFHDLVDSEVGNILSGFPYAFTPGASVYITQGLSITATTVNTATWTAYNPGPSFIATATDSASVYVIEFNFIPVILKP
jgi:hypothetical protein